MIRTNVNIGRDLLGLIALTETAAARMIAVRVVAEFNTLLLSAPQYSGNYVANMRISIGSSARGEGATEAYKRHPKQLKRKGNMAPINRARDANNLDSFEERFVAHALKGNWTGMNVTVWNPLLNASGREAAQYIEGMPEWRMRDPNKPEGLNSLAKFNARMENVYVNITAVSV